MAAQQRTYSVDELCKIIHFTRRRVNELDKFTAGKFFFSTSRLRVPAKFCFSLIFDLTESTFRVSIFSSICWIEGRWSRKFLILDNAMTELGNDHYYRYFRSFGLFIIIFGVKKGITKLIKPSEGFLQFCET